MADVDSRQSEPTAPASTAARAWTFLRRRRRRKVLGWALLVVLALVTTGVLVIYRARPRRAEHTAAVVPQSLPAGARQGLAGFSYTSNERGHPVFTIRAQRSVDFKNGEGTTLSGVEVEMFGRTGNQHNLLSAQSCQYLSKQGDFTCSGPVKIELDAPPGISTLQTPPSAASNLRGRQPIYLNTLGISYSQRKALVTTDSHVKWQYGTSFGTAEGLVYSTESGNLKLDHDVVATLPVEERRIAGAAGHTVMQLAAAQLLYDKPDQRIELAGPVHLAEGAREVRSERAVVRLDAQNRLTAALFEGAVQVEDRTPESPLVARAAAINAAFEPSTGNLQSLEATGGIEARSGPGTKAQTAQLTADRARVTFVGAHFHPSEGVAWGNVRVNIEPVARREPPGIRSVSGPAPGQTPDTLRREELETAQLDMAFHPFTGTFDRARTVGPGKLVLMPAGDREGRRVVTAGQLLMGFDGLGRLDDLKGTAPTRIVFEPAPGAQPGKPTPESRADALHAQIDPASGVLESIEQAGHFELLDGDAVAAGAQAVYSAGGQAATLTGKPSLDDPDTRIRADRFVVHLATNTADGFGHVTSTHLGPWAKAAPGGPASAAGEARAASRRTGEAPRDAHSAAPMNVIADRVFSDRNQQYVRYEGHVRAWQGPDVIESPSLDIYRKERRVVSGAGVLTSDLAPTPAHERPLAPSSSSKRGHPAQAASGGPGATEPVTIRADRLEYTDFGRRAVYRGHVRMDASGATLGADQLDAYFTEGTPTGRSELDHAVADGHVTLVEPGRRAASDHGEYFATSGKVVMTGGPPTVYDADEGFATGRSLTFFVHDDTLLVDGGQGVRALSEHPFSP